MTTAPKIRIKLLYNNYDITQDFSKYVLSITYKDFEDNESDELIITLKDPDKLYQNNWYPQKGAKITCFVTDEKSSGTLNCGRFTIDELNMDFSQNGDVLTIRALAATTTLPVRTINSTYFEKSTLYNIAQKFCDKFGLNLSQIIFGKDVDIFGNNVSRINQFLETDLEFLKRIAYTYGYTFKLTDNLLTFIKPLTNHLSKFNLSKTNVKSVSIKDKSVKKYKACKISYYNPLTKKLNSLTVSGGNGQDILKIRKKFNSRSEGEQIAKSYLNNNTKEVTGRIELKEPISDFIAGVSFRLSGFGIFDKVYRIKSSTHRITPNGWRVSGEIEQTV